MATTAISVVQLVVNTKSAVARDTDGTVATSTTDGWVCTLPTGITLEKVFFRLIAVTNTDTIVFKAGTNPPAKGAGVGDLSVTLAVNTDVWNIVLDPGRFLKSDGTVVIIPGQTTTKILAYAFPVGIGGGGTF